MHCEDNDEMLERFLKLLAEDIENRPDRLRPLDANLLARTRSLVGNMTVDLDAPLPKEDV